MNEHTVTREWLPGFNVTLDLSAFHEEEPLTNAAIYDVLFKLDHARSQIAEDFTVQITHEFGDSIDDAHDAACAALEAITSPLYQDGHVEEIVVTEPDGSVQSFEFLWYDDGDPENGPHLACDLVPLGTTGPCIVCGAYDGDHDEGCAAAPMDAKGSFAQLLTNLLEVADPDDGPRVASVESYAARGFARDEGLVVRMSDGSEFQVTIVQSR